MGGGEGLRSGGLPGSSDTNKPRYLWTSKEKDNGTQSTSRPRVGVSLLQYLSKTEIMSIGESGAGLTYGPKRGDSSNKVNGISTQIRETPEP